MNQYKPGDKVKIISMEKVRSYPKNKHGNYEINGLSWIEEKMNKYAGTQVVIEYGFGNRYGIVGSSYYFSPEMIEGPVDPVEQEGEGQEELWREVFNPPTVHGSYLKELLDKYTITRKNNPQ